MTVYNIADPDLALPGQMVVDTSLLLALRPKDDNPHRAIAQSFMRRLADQVTAYKMIVWLPLPVLQECYHIILMNGLRRAWEALPPVTRPTNWLKAYKDQPDLIRPLIPELTQFHSLLAAIPVTPVRPDDIVSLSEAEPLEKRLLDFIAAYFLLPQDALILAHAERLSVFNVATLDQDWRRAILFNIYTVL